MDVRDEDGFIGKKKSARTTREINAATYLLRCKQIGLTFDEIDALEVGMVWDLMTEMANDNVEYPLKAGQEQFNEFLGG